MPLVSVIVPTYNCADFVATAVQSVLNQTERDFEVIVVDDGSTDDTDTALARFGDAIRVVRRANTGVAAARNAGLALARGDWIAFLDADDYWVPTRLSTQLTALRGFPKAGFAFSDFDVIDASGTQLRPSGIRWKYRSVRDPRAAAWQGIFQESHDFESGDASECTTAYCGDVYRALFLGNFVNTSSVLVRRRLISETSGFDTSLETEEDYDCWLRLARGTPFVFVDAPLVAFRVRANQLTTSSQLERIVRNALNVVKRASGTGYRELSKKDVGLRLAVLHRDLGIICLRGGRNAEARRQFLASLTYSAWQPVAVALIGMSVLPKGLFATLEARRRSFRSEA
jgi:glycosyltransferase involved in cell wall biosynthesis